MEEPFHFLPTEFVPLIGKTHTIRMRFPLVVYLNVLLYFCLHHLGDNNGKIIALQDLELTISERYFIINNKEQLKTANQCLSIAKSII